MKSKLLIGVALVLGGSLLTTSCLQDKCTTTQTYTQYTPVYKSMDEIRQMVKVQPAKEILNARTPYIYGKLLFINDYSAGIHVYDNSNPENPVAISFLQIPGNVHMSIKDNYLYADNFIDLVVFNISDPNNIQFAGSLQNTFPENISVNEVADRWLVDASQGIAIDWIEEEVEVDCDGYYPLMNSGIYAEDVAVGAPERSQGGTGKGGSMARFTIVNDYLYVIDNSKMQLFDLSTPQKPAKSNEVEIGFGIETIFPFYRDQKSYLFIGSTTGMFIYDNENPKFPSQIGTMQHVSSCDPVVAEKNFAFVTLRSGTQCNGFTNELDLVDISTIENPVMVRSFSMTNPYGVGVENNLVFVCDGDAGMKVYDLRALSDIEMKGLNSIETHKVFTFASAATYDVILNNNIALLTTKDGFYQFDYSDPTNIKLLSHRP